MSASNVTIAAPPDRLTFEPDGGVPNNPMLPVVLVRGAVDPSMSAEGIRSLYEANGWCGTWTWSVFGYHHFHPDAHEALTVASGWGELLLGGPDGVTVRVERGDLVVLPAGVGHCRLASSPDFSVCGAYPPGQASYETLRAGEGGAQVAARIASVPLPSTDPIAGADGALIDAWNN